jgi:nitroreductase
MDIFEAIRQRRSIRSYTNEDVTEEEINILLEAAIRVPSACNRQTWRVVHSPSSTHPDQKKRLV